MPGEVRTSDGRYLLVDQDDGNAVVYLAETMEPLWDRWTFEAGREGLVAPPIVPPAPAAPISAVGAARVIRVTDESDGPFAPRMMSDRANAFIQDGAAWVFCGTDTGPRLFKVDLASGHVDRLGLIGGYGGETEGWYWLKTGRIVLPHGPRLLSVNPFNVEDVQAALDISDTHPGHDLWQPHSSDDGRTHSATVRRIVESGKYPYVGTIIEGQFGRRFVPAVGQLDESQPTRLGTHVIIKQPLNANLPADDNHIIDLATAAAWELSDADGAFGHSDCGPDFIVGECNLPGPGRCVKLDLRTGERVTLFETDNMGYVSVRGGLCLQSDDTHLSLVSLTGSGRVLLHAHGATGVDNYDNRPKANLDPTGRVAVYMSNVAGRQDVYLLIL